MSTPGLFHTLDIYTLPNGKQRKSFLPDSEEMARTSPQGLILSLPHFLKSRSLEGVPGSTGKSQKMGREDQGEVKELGETFPWLF